MTRPTGARWSRHDDEDPGADRDTSGIADADPGGYRWQRSSDGGAS